MNEIVNSILSRRSVRKFKREQISDEDLQVILEAGKFAPSAMNQQSWHFTVIQNKELLQKINQACKFAFINSGNKNFADRAKAENFQIFYEAPTLIIVTADANAIAPQNDGSLALGNMFNAAQALNIGSCWIHGVGFMLFSEEGKALKNELGIPKGYVFVGSGAFGFADMEPAAPPRKEGTVTIFK